MPQTFDPSKPFTLAAEAPAFDPSKPFTATPARPIVALGPAGETEAEAQTRGFKEGVQGGLKGFVQGLADSPQSFAEGIVHLLTTSPVTSVKEAIAAIKSLPDAIRESGNDPEGWGRKVGNVTGQQMIGVAAPTVVSAGARGAAAVGNAVADAVTSPLAARVAPKILKYGGAATGGAVGGWPGAIVGREVGADLGEALRAKMNGTGPAPAPTPAATSLIDELASGAPMGASDFLSRLRQLSPEQRAGVLAARQAALEGSARTPAAERPALGGPLAAQRAAFDAQTPPQTAPAAQTAPPAAVAAPVEAPAPQPVQPAARPIFKPGEAMDAARVAFKTLGETPGPAELSNAASLMKFGKSADEAVATMIAKRPPAAALSPAEELAKRLGTPSQAEMLADMRARAVGGQKTLMPKYASDVPPTPTASVKTGAEALQNAPIAPKVVDGRTVRPDVPNMGSIESSLTDYEVLPGVREVKMSDFDPAYKPKPYSVSEEARLNKLTRDIAENKEISPLIVVVDKENFPYILEGGHRFDALRMLKAKSFPAVVVRDLESLGSK